MPRVTPQAELDQLVALIAAQPDGLGIDAITQSQGNSLTRRTLQRRLALLVAQGRIRMLGEARALGLAHSNDLLPGYVALGEEKSAALVAIACDRIGLDACALSVRELGIVAEVYPQATFAEQSMAFATRLAQGPTQFYAKAKALVNQSLTQSLEAQVAAETDAVCETIQTHDFREGVTAFLQKRQPVFKGK